jgi:hypothetical protein
MKTGTIFAIIAIGFFIYILHLLWQEWKEGRKKTPGDELYDLMRLIEHSIIDNNSELCIIQKIKELRLRGDIDPYKLDLLDIQFRQKFQELHQRDSKK